MPYVYLVTAKRPGETRITFAQSRDIQSEAHRLAFSLLMDYELVKVDRVSADAIVIVGG